MVVERKPARAIPEYFYHQPQNFQNKERMPATYLPSARISKEREIQIVRRAQENDPEAQTELFVEYYPRIVNYMQARCGEREVAEDLAVDTILLVFAALPRWENRGLPFSGWVFRIAHNYYVSAVIRQKRNGGEVALDQVSPMVEQTRFPDLEKEVEQRFLIHEVIDAVDQLSPLQKKVIALRFGRGLPPKEVAQLVGKTETHVKVEQHKAIERLRKILREDEWF